MKKLLSLQIKGEKHTWDFDFFGDPKFIDTWRKDGLDISEIENTIPKFIADLKLTRMWCFAQDIINFKNPFK